jgi:multidrug resistance protein MdtO
MKAALLVRQIWQDLQPTPGRARDAWKVTVAALCVCLFMLSTSMPFVDLGTYLVFLLAQRDSLRVRMMVSGSIAVAGLATLLVVGVMTLAWDVAWLRLLLWTVIFFVGFFFMRVAIEPDLFLGALVIVALCTFIADQVPAPNVLLDQVGWLWALLPVVAAAVLLTDWLFGRSTPRQALQKQVWGMLRRVEKSMRERAEGGNPVPWDEAETHDAVERASLLGTLGIFSKNQAGRCVEILQAVGKLEARAEQLTPSALPPRFWHALADALAALRESLRRGPPASVCITWPGVPEDAALAEALTNLREVVERIAAALPPGTVGNPHAMSLLLPDWKTNAAYISFALRATAATMGTYLFMSLTHWNGIHTCMITCVVTALTSIDGQVRKQNLRMAGAVVGAVAGVASLLFFLPRHDSLFGLLLVLLITSFAAAWVAVGPLRVYYAGYQMALAVYYVLLADPHISTKLEPIRDRLIGIFVGILAMRVAFLWGSKTTRPIHHKLLRPETELKKLSG